MAESSFATELARYGPQAVGQEPSSLETARTYCRRLAQSHYENFSVASLLLPRPLRQHFYHVYAYCRWADDLADETGDPAASLKLLDWWEHQLEDCYQGHAMHPVFVALAETIRTFAIPADPLRNLLIAFRQDQKPQHFATRNEQLAYCQNSANPVGHLVLYLGRCYNADRAALADHICTGLQLANFCQDVARDWAQGRVYLPADRCASHGFNREDFARQTATPEFRRLLAEQVEYTDSLLTAGLPLIKQIPRSLQADVELFATGGRAILSAIRRADYDVWTRRPTVGRWQKLRLLTAAWWRSRGRGGRP